MSDEYINRFRLSWVDPEPSAEAWDYEKLKAEADKEIKPWNFMESDPETGSVVICALRYCIGRRSYMPGTITEWVKRHWHKLSTNHQNIIYKDLEQEITSGRDLGDDCDVQTWHSFWEWVKQNRTS